MLHLAADYSVYCNGLALPCIIPGGMSVVWTSLVVRQLARSVAGYQFLQTNYHIAELYGMNLRHR